MHLSATQQRIYDAVCRNPGIRAARLRDLVWADDPNGGPENRHNLYVQINRMNRKLAVRHLAINARGGGYRLALLDR